MNNLKKITSLFLMTLIAFSVTLTSCEDDDDDSPNITLSAASAEIEVGQSAEITISGGTAPFAAVSANVEIATVAVTTNKVNITAVSKGTTTVVVTDSKQKTKSIEVVVKEATALPLDKNEVSVAVGNEDVVTITGGTAPFTATVGDAEVATAEIQDNKVTIKGIKAGTTTVTIKDKDEALSGTVSVTVE